MRRSVVLSLAATVRGGMLVAFVNLGLVKHISNNVVVSLNVGIVSLLRSDGRVLCADGVASVSPLSLGDSVRGVLG